MKLLTELELEHVVERFVEIVFFPYADLQEKIRILKTAPSLEDIRIGYLTSLRPKYLYVYVNSYPISFRLPVEMLESDEKLNQLFFLKAKNKIHNFYFEHSETNSEIFNSRRVRVLNRSTSGLSYR